jgi:hypothetical protein
MTLTAEALETEIKRQQPAHDVYPLEIFCRACGTGHLGTPGVERGSCRKCDQPMFNAIYRRYPRAGTTTI